MAEQQASMDKLIQLGTDQLTGIIEGAKAAVPKITDTVLLVTSWNCISYLVIGAILVTISLMFLLIGKLFYNQGVIRSDNREDRWDDRHIPWFIGAIVCSGISIILLLCGLLGHLFNVWYWIGVWHPDLYLVHQAIETMTSRN